jgi:GTP-binding protein EngB required for normal cell division
LTERRKAAVVRPMGIGRHMRLVLVLAVLVGLAAVAAGAVGVAGSLIEIWDRLREGPALVFYGLLFFLVAIAGLASWLVWSILLPRKSKRKRRTQAPLTEDGLQKRLADGRESGLDIGEAERELIELTRRRDSGTLYLCMAGEISTGKSSLISAMAPDAEVEIGVSGGTTEEVSHHRWLTPSGDQVVLADVPGTGASGEGIDELGLNEALRAHVVAYVCDGDLGRSQFQDLKTLIAMGKPIVLVLNKSDRYNDQETQTLYDRLSERLVEAGAGRDAELVTVSAGETMETKGGRSGRPQVETLLKALQRQIDRSPEALNDMRDTAVFSMVAANLDEAETEHRKVLAKRTVESYTRKAVVGAMAAVSPGTDVLIQGYLGTGLVRELCKIFEVSANDIDTGRLLELSQGYVGKSLPILLAVAGNALKAFPGIGTIAGGLTHAVAYGLIFDALGRGLTSALEEGGDLRPATAARKFGENLGEDLRTRTIRLARLALEEKNRGAE